MTEVVLLGQTVNSYHDGTHDFADLLRAVGAVSGIRRLRFTSPHPNDFSDRVIGAMAETPAVCEHVHLPMQSGSTRSSSGCCAGILGRDISDASRGCARPARGWR